MSSPAGVDDLLRVPDGLLGHVGRLGLEDDRVSSYGYRYVLPVRFAYRAMTDDGLERLRYSFMSLDRSTAPPELVVGEYGNSKQTRRLARFPLDPRRCSWPRVRTASRGRWWSTTAAWCAPRAPRSRTACWYLTRSTGEWVPGSVYAGRPGAFRRYRWATPMGPEDIAWWPSTDLLWSVTEHPRRRWIYSMKRKRFG